MILTVHLVKNSLDANTTGDNNVAMGFRALEANTTGEQNVAVGALALDVQNHCRNNTAIGYDDTLKCKYKWNSKTAGSWVGVHFI